VLVSLLFEVNLLTYLERAMKIILLEYALMDTKAFYAHYVKMASFKKENLNVEIVNLLGR